MDGKELVCEDCGNIMTLEDSEIWWDYSAMSYDIELIKCKKCGRIHELKCETIDIDINNDDRYFY